MEMNTKYQVRFGEHSFKSITMRFLGKNSTYRWKELQKANQEISENKLCNGIVINIPKEWITDWFKNDTN